MVRAAALPLAKRARARPEVYRAAAQGRTGGRAGRPVRGLPWRSCPGSSPGQWRSPGDPEGRRCRRGGGWFVVGGPSTEPSDRLLPQGTTHADGRGFVGGRVEDLLDLFACPGNCPGARRTRPRPAHRNAAPSRGHRSAHRSTARAHPECYGGLALAVQSPASQPADPCDFTSASASHEHQRDGGVTGDTAHDQHRVWTRRTASPTPCAPRDPGLS